MTRFWLQSAASIVAVTGSFVATTALAGHGSHGGHSFGGASRISGNVTNRIHSSPFQGRVGGNMGGGLRPTTPKFPTGPLNPGKSPVGPFKPPVGPFKPPVVTTPTRPKLPTGPLGPIGPLKPPKGPIVGPFKPPMGPLGPIGPIKPPGTGGGVGGGGSGTGGGSGSSHHHHRPHWPTIVLGCLPCTGTVVGGTYCPPVYTQPVLVPASTPVVVSSAAPIVSAPVSTDVVTASAETAVEPAASDPAITDPAPATEKLPQVPVGSTLALQAKDLGDKTGQVLLVIDKLTLAVQIDEWAAEHTIATIPQIGITQPTKAELIVVRADGQPASSVKVELVAAKSATSGDPTAVADARN